MDKVDNSNGESTQDKTTRRKSVDAGIQNFEEGADLDVKKPRGRRSLDVEAVEISVADADEVAVAMERDTSAELNSDLTSDIASEMIQSEDDVVEDEGVVDDEPTDAAVEDKLECGNEESFDGKSNTENQRDLSLTLDESDDGEVSAAKQEEVTTITQEHDASRSEENLPKVGSPSGGGEQTKTLGAILVKVALILSLVGGATYALVRISKPLLISFATWLLRSQPREEDDYYSREVTVEAERVLSATMPKHIDTIGELKANASVILHSEVSGCIKEIHFIEGSNVKKGELLIKLDDDIHQAEFRAHKSQYEAAKAEFERQEKIRSSGAGSIRDYDKAHAEMNAGKAKMESSEAQLRRTEIRAPFEGVIGIIDICEGAFVQPNQELVTVVDQTPIKVKFGVPGKFVNDVGVGQSVELRVDAHKDRVFRGTVEAVDSYVDSSTNCVALRASIPNEDGALKAGLFASVSLIIGLQGETITIDESAVERMGEQEYVWVVDRGKARRVPILTGSRERGRIEVIAGLKDKQVVVTSGQRGLSDGRYVKVVNMEPDPELEAVKPSDEQSHE
ncbi:MAG: efflux RND transporter periplasmic adaptor subunit [Holosporales bacterium]|nr:efflux RND transporter periplasmic adaptor subunit [Holosporales bacterium]